MIAINMPKWFNKAVNKLRRDSFGKAALKLVVVHAKLLGTRCSVPLNSGASGCLILKSWVGHYN
ncbi:hypothetical protein PR202_gb00106 [Eleusine coracana subsp. coracana]|uniref:Uncharacterized protein n=1 Tax=Eleusine coracana subsp. coracana TaxID=191504 RepID=A0AAV5DT84_ELECO|nr:hypothetical protein PR202_gb00106 [Eleusine coracana subsp. coracana]